MEGEPYIDGEKMAERFHRRSVEVENILDKNKLLIKEINHNQESKIPYNLRRNVGLIRELNNNISKVVDLYAGLSKSMEEENDSSSSSQRDSTATASYYMSAGHKRKK